MTTSNRWSNASKLTLFMLAGAVILSVVVAAQDRLKTMPGFEQYLRMSKDMQGAVKVGALAVTWKDGGKAFEYPRDGKIYRYDIATKATSEVTAPAEAAPAAPGGRGGLEMRAGRDLGGGPARGRQVASAESPDKTLKAFHRDRNLYVSDAAGANEAAVTTDGSEKERIKYGTASWVYGEELNQTTVMWWSLDSWKLAYYWFDEK